MFSFHSKQHTAATTFATLALWFGISPPALAAGLSSLRTVALSGQPPVGTIAADEFQRFDVAPVINDSGQVAFFAAPRLLVGEPFAGNTSVWSEQNGVLNLVVEQGDAAPGFEPKVEFSEFFDLAFNNAGHTAFRSRFSGEDINAQNRDSIWLSDSAVLQPYLRSGSAAPGSADSAIIDAIVDPFAINDAGQIAVNLEVAGNGGIGLVEAGLWSGRPGQVVPVARAGQQAPGTELGVVFASQGFEPPFSEQTRINAAGNVAFQGFLTGPGVVDANNGGIWSNASASSLQLIARNGDIAPGTGGLRFLSVTSRPNINSSGHANFLAFLEPGPTVTELNRIGIWSTRSGDLELVFRLGDRAPGADADVNFLDLQTPVMNSGGSLAMVAVVTGPGVNSSNETGIWSEGLAGQGNLELVARANDPAPGTGAGVTFANFLDPTINELGQIAFQAILAGPGVGDDEGNLRGLWAQSTTGDLKLIAREGDLLEVAPGDFRTIDFLLFASGVGDDEGRARGLNDQGQIAFHARFTDGSGGVFVSNVVAIPEPSASDLTVCALLVVIGIFLVARRQQFVINSVPPSEPHRLCVSHPL